MREQRSLKASELRVAADTEGGKRYLEGYAANYNVMSRDLGWGMYERIMPGAFKRAVEEKQDVFHLINHDPSQILGRTQSGTTELRDDSKGLAFRTLINESDPSAVAFAARVGRGDINECSFAFSAVRTVWIDEPDPDNPKEQRQVRELHDVDLYDVATVTYPAYPQTNTVLAAIRSDGNAVPAEFRAKVGVAVRGGGDEETSLDCDCGCIACLDGECEDCLDPDCDDENCRCEYSMRARKPAQRDGTAKMKKVDGEDLTADCFIIVGDENDPGTWKLPWKFSSIDKIKSHLRNALARFNQMKSVDADTKAKAWDKLVELCKNHGIDVNADENKAIRERLTKEQVASFTFDTAMAVAYSRSIELQASL